MGGIYICYGKGRLTLSAAMKRTGMSARASRYDEDKCKSPHSEVEMGGVAGM